MLLLEVRRTCHALVVVVAVGAALLGCPDRDGGSSGTPSPTPAPTCTDATVNGTESDVDCGGACTACGDSRGCAQAADCVSGVCAVRVCQPAACGDTVANGTETDVDCGGGACGPCAVGRHCTRPVDCADGACTAGVCQAASCVDGARNGTETDLDCGGPACTACADTRACAEARDCASGVCTGGTCRAPTCNDTVRNAVETDVDCGGGTCSRCVDNRACMLAADCQSGACDAARCVPAGCQDQLSNGLETDVDCGGGVCTPCPDGKDCLAAADCTSGVCGGGSCLAPTCLDATRNGAESDVDCGGGSCGTCADTRRCNVPSDCAGRVCSAGICGSISCTDVARNGAETDVDCGGGICDACADGRTCVVPMDCLGGVCFLGTCATPSCGDLLANGLETDVDCGGGACNPCEVNRACVVHEDCVNTNCVGFTCRAPTCSDGTQNSAETDVDCGGGTCAPCQETQTCNVPADCAEGFCAAGSCLAPCDDLVRNGAETAVDCGGGRCVGCGRGMACQEDRDCDSDACAAGRCVLPDPADVAPPNDPTVALDFFDSIQFLFDGPDAIQTLDDTFAIVPERAAALRGRVLDRAGAPVPEVDITVVDHPEFGSTQTRADGVFDLVVNGGGTLTLNYARQGLLPAQRTAVTGWQDWGVLPDVVMIPRDPLVTAVDLSAVTGVAVARGSVETDADGTRRATLFFFAGTSAAMVVNDLPVPLTTINVRATEYTVGRNGQQAMPGLLPAPSGYTYAVELGVDEAVTAGATTVLFSQPVSLYVENFLSFPVGGIAPTGFYDKACGCWVPSPNGRVIQIVGLTGDLAELDVAGLGVPATPAELLALLLTDDERRTLAATYAVGATLWRTQVTHFTPYDVNWPIYLPPLDAAPPPPPNNPPPPPPEDPCEAGGSIIGCEDQSLGEVLPIAGTPYTLRYDSKRAPGRNAKQSVTIPITGPVVPASLLEIRVEINVAGELTRLTFPPLPDQSHQFVWRGKDRFGRDAPGRQRVLARVDYVYPVKYRIPNPVEDVSQGDAFARYTATNQISNRFLFPNSGRTTVRSQYHPFEVSRLIPQDMAPGGWALEQHHQHDPRAFITVRRVVVQAPTPPLPSIHALAFGPDGSMYFTGFNEDNDFAILRRQPDGTEEVLTGTRAGGETWGGEDGYAEDVAFAQRPDQLLVAADGTVFFLVRMIRFPFVDTVSVVGRITPDGQIIHVAGDLFASGFSGDDGPAVNAQVSDALRMALGPANDSKLASCGTNLYLADGARVRRVGSNGNIWTVAGTGGPATVAPYPDPINVQLAQLGTINSLAVAGDGNIYVAGSTVRSIGPDGFLQNIPGVTVVEGRACTNPDLRADLVGNVYVHCTHAATPLETSGGAAATWNNIYRLTPEGSVVLLIGTPGPPRAGAPFVSYGAPAATAALQGPTIWAVHPSGRLHLAGRGSTQLAQVEAPVVTTVTTTFGVSVDGTEVYVFDRKGRHHQTVDALTGAVRITFTYDATGRVDTLTDAWGQTTYVDRDGNGAPLRIEAPSGQRTTFTLDANGYLASVTDPAGAVTTLQHDGDGLLTALIEPGGGRHVFAYDAAGRLVRDTDAAGGFSALSRTEGAGSFEVARTTSLGREWHHGVTTLPGAVTQRTTQAPSGAVTTVQVFPTGLRALTTAEGLVSSSSVAPDPRFGMLAPMTSRLTVTTPAGLVSQYVNTRTATLAAPGDLLNLASSVETTTINGRVYRAAYNGAARTLTRTSPAGRTAVVTLNAQGVPGIIQGDSNVEPAYFDFDAQGRLAETYQGNQTTFYEYDVNGQVMSREDALGNVMRYAWDEGGHLLSTTLPSGRVYAFAYDSNGNRIRVTMPNGALHGISYSVTNLSSGYHPPQGTAYSSTFDLDGDLTRATLPSGRTVDVTRDVGGRITARSYAEATTTLAYSDTTTRVDTVTQTPTSGPAAQAVGYSYDGNLVVGVTFDGPATGAFSYRYDANFFLVGTTLDGALETTTTRDGDGLVTGFGSFAVTRGGPQGATTSLTDGTLVMSLAHDDLGRVDQRMHTVDTAAIYADATVYDDAGRVSQRTETVAGMSVVLDYVYDADSQLAAVWRDGALVQQYAYDVNGNRTSVARGTAAPDVSTYDAMDTLLQLGALPYTFDADGFLASRGTDTFLYSTRGELLRFTGGGQSVTYGYDGLGRRTSRASTTGTTQYLYGNLDNPFLITHSRDSGGVLTTYFHDEEGRLTALDRGSVRFYVGADVVGTPRVVTDAAGTVVKLLDFDAFGALLLDSAPAFELPVGFAGGLWDVDSGLVRFGLRDYDPAAGRWTARDPLLVDSTQLNLYVYVGNNPVNLRDPMGLWSVSASAFFGFGVGGTFAWTGNGLSICGEIGAGLGESLEFDPLGGLDDSGATLKVSAKVKAGMLDAEFAGKVGLAECGRGLATKKAAIKVAAGPLQASADLTTGDSNLGPAKKKLETDRGKLKVSLPVGASAQVKVSGQVCKQVKF